MDVISTSSQLVTIFLKYLELHCITAYLISKEAIVINHKLTELSSRHQSYNYYGSMSYPLDQGKSHSARWQIGLDLGLVFK